MRPRQSPSRARTSRLPQSGRRAVPHPALALLPLLVVLLGAGWARRRLLLTTVHGRSMEPALRDGDTVLVRRVPQRRLRTGQIVICPVQLPDGATFLPPPGSERHHLWIKRIAALPGDPLPPGVPGHPGRVPEGSAILLGDNREASIDSRRTGPVPLDRIIGVAQPFIIRATAPC
ncbi:S26 family signal peptidase [Streptomyces sp. NPDC050255]|uniref:S26 family signal peptidase n=1 Tax=Streptomyces sp. NPDC050255 TaxID=3365606 RepID=UPI0037AA07CB